MQSDFSTMHKAATLLMGTLDKLDRGQESLSIEEAVFYAFSELENVRAEDVPALVGMLFEVQQALIAVRKSSVETRMRIDVAKIVREASTLLGSKPEEA